MDPSKKVGRVTNTVARNGSENNEVRCGTVHLHQQQQLLSDELDAVRKKYQQQQQFVAVQKMSVLGGGDGDDGDDESGEGDESDESDGSDGSDEEEYADEDYDREDEEEYSDEKEENNIDDNDATTTATTANQQGSVVKKTKRKRWSRRAKKVPK